MRIVQVMKQNKNECVREKERDCFLLLCLGLVSLSLASAVEMKGGADSNEDLPGFRLLVKPEWGGGKE